MSEIDKWVQNTIINEKTNNKLIVVYSGRFQPMGKHHFQVYKKLTEQFDTVYIATSNKTELPNSPFNFKEKQTIIESYGIDSTKIVEVSNPYKATEIKEQYDSSTTSVLFVVGQKDSDRLANGKFFHVYEGQATIGYDDGAYIMTAPHEDITVEDTKLSGTEIRQMLGNPHLTEDKRKLIYNEIFSCDSVYDLIVNKLIETNNTLNEFATYLDLSTLIQEASLTSNLTTSGGRGGTDVDDGPGFMYPKLRNYKKNSSRRAQTLGWDIVDYLVPELELQQLGTEYPNGPVDAVSYFPSGQAGKRTPMNQKDYKGTKAYNMWKKHITNIIGNIGYEFVNWKKDSVDIKSSNKDEPNTTSKETSVVEEDISLPVNIGDTVLMGKFKNRKEKVKTIDWNEKGDLKINGKSALKMRIPEKPNIFGTDPRYKDKETEDSVKEETEDDIYDEIIKYDFESPSGESRSREITYASVIAHGKEHPLYDKVRKLIDNHNEDKKIDETLDNITNTKFLK